LTGYQKSRDAVANFYSCPEAPLEGKVRHIIIILSFRFGLSIRFIPKYIYITAGCLHSFHIMLL